MKPSIEFRLLGPVEAWRGTERLTLGGRKPRALLAALLLQPGRVVSAESLIDLIWDQDPPDTARTLVQTYIWTLRQALGDLIETRPPGYLIHLPSAQTDRDRFVHWVARGREAAGRGRFEDAAAAFLAALGCWRGPALGGIGGVLQSAAARLEEERLSAIEERAAAELATGNEMDIHELAALVAEHPTRERLRGHLMLALYRSGRQADALQSYEAGRRLLADELGIDPDPELRGLHAAILRADPDLRAPHGPPASPAPKPPLARAPALLPPATADFTARTDLMAQLNALLLGSREAVPVCVVSGTGGVGKSTLAVQAAHRVRTDYPDGQLYADLRGAAARATPGEILGRFLGALGHPVPDTLAERVDLFRSTLADRRVLLVLDDAASEEQVRPLVPAGSGCAVLITSRSRLPGLTGVHRVDLDVLDTDESVELLRRIAGPERVGAAPELAQQVVALCGHLPLALRTAGARLATRRHWSLQTLVTRLSDERRRLDELAVGDLAVRASVGLSYHALDALTRRAFRLLGLLGVPDFAAWLVGALLDTDEFTAEEMVERLVDAQLLSVVSVGRPGEIRYRIHDLHRVYAAERATAEESLEDRRAAVARALGSWLWLIRRFAAESPSGEVEMCTRYTTARAGAPVPEDPAEWFVAESNAVVAAVERAAALDLDVPALEVALALCSSFFGVGNRFDAWWRTHHAAITATRRAGNRSGEAMLLAGVGQLRYNQDRYAEAHDYLDRALPLFEEAGDLRGQAAVRAGTGSTYREQGRLAAARHALAPAVAAFAEVKDDAGLGYASRLLASVDLEQGRCAEAMATLATALEAYRRLGSRRGEALTLRTTGLVHRALGDHGRAKPLFEQALALLSSLGDQLMSAYAQQALSKTRIRLGTCILPPLLDALDVCRAHQDRLGEGLVLRTIGELHLAEGRPAEAEAHLLGAIAAWDGLGVPLFRARAQRDLAAVYETVGDGARAAALRATALAVFRELDAREQYELGHRKPG
ncbi:BTAD domain-containing putative transcriptional regulator [Streptomyces sp. NBC_01443]|uniref:AfsR/SARP family transcriptional regulator n=1 Tax=Streptomyces sp. NBC_01443 TaxID=2903868 RepID=UPI00225A5229|nr:BTAD domain-containing putative transcriptional regulator [Streptomyces sp. NBC_01443]MCX4627097.1 tetratricopeptide repeat protein [Streptomyces sp. NBC_01443]